MNTDGIRIDARIHHVGTSWVRKANANELKALADHLYVIHNSDGPIAVVMNYELFLQLQEQNPEDKDYELVSKIRVTYNMLSLESATLFILLRHQVERNHDFAPGGCSLCDDARKAIAAKAASTEVGEGR